MSSANSGRVRSIGTRCAISFTGVLSGSRQVGTSSGFLLLSLGRHPLVCGGGLGWSERGAAHLLHLGDGRLRIIGNRRDVDRDRSAGGVRLTVGTIRCAEADCAGELAAGSFMSLLMYADFTVALFEIADGLLFVTGEFGAGVCGIAVVRLAFGLGDALLFVFRLPERFGGKLDLIGRPQLPGRNFLNSIGRLLRSLRDSCSPDAVVRQKSQAVEKRGTS